MEGGGEMGEGFVEQWGRGYDEIRYGAEMGGWDLGEVMWR